VTRRSLNRQADAEKEPPHHGTRAGPEGIFDTTRTAVNPDDRYRIPIDYPQRQYTETWTWLVCALEGSPPPL
jgi:hypothetical protein